MTNKSDSLGLWHNRMGHPCIANVKQVLHSCNIPCSFNKMFFCDACAIGRSHALPFSSSQTTYGHPLQLVQTDIWGSSPMNSFNGFHYYISFVDMFTRYIWVYLLKSKSKVSQVFKPLRILLNFNSVIDLKCCKLIVARSF